MSLDVEINEEVEYGVSVLFEGNVTHNLTDMAEIAGLYLCIWRPLECGFEFAKDLITPLADGHAYLVDNAEECKKYNPPNGGGTYEGFCKFVWKYYQACLEFPNAKISVCS